MSESQKTTLAQKVTATFIDIDPEDVFEDARELGLEVSQVEDFRAFDNDDSRITELMDEYVESTASSSAFTGMTTGLGGVTTTVLLGGADLISVSIKLYRLSQRLAVLKGIDPLQSLSKKKCHSIYLGTLGLNAATEAVLRKQMMKRRPPWPGRKKPPRIHC
ncbi:MAG: hypothetical protein U5K69_09180 [Balneolaceae bacterium]|nr:hypothetical protein [Balneolaceae bacterium]